MSAESVARHQLVRNLLDESSDVTIRQALVQDTEADDSPFSSIAVPGVWIRLCNRVTETLDASGSREPPVHLAYI